MINSVRVAISTALLLASAPAWAQTSPAPPLVRTSPTAGAEARMRATCFAALTDTRVSIVFDMTTAREAFEKLASQLPVPLIVRWSDDVIGYGIDPNQLVGVDVTDRPALDALELLLAQCALQGDPCTWQIRKGFIEAGTKERLSAPAARVRVIYPIADLIMDVRESYRDRRVRREVVALELVERVVTTIEPGSWDYGQDPPVDDEEGFEELFRAAFGEDEDPAAQDPDAPDAKRTPPPRRYRPPAYPALIRYWRDVVIVDAPPYYHRQLAGLKAAPKEE